jgi:hypothetical protein
MRRLLNAVAVAVAMALIPLVWCPLVHAQSGAAETAGQGWIDLFPGKDLAGWKRAPILPDTKLAAKNPWSVDKDKKILLCDGIGIKEMLLHDKPFADGVFHVEWRFHPVKPAKDMEMPLYNSGIYVRTDLKGTYWHQAQVAHNVKPPFMGDLFGKTRRGPDIADFLVKGDGPKHIKGSGHWNTYDIACAGKTISVRVNGQEACVMKDCEVPTGYLGMQAEFFVIEFRELKFQPRGGD